MEDIASTAGVSKPILYRHFIDQADLYSEVGRRAARMLLDALTDQLGRQRAPRELLAAVIDTYLRAIESDPELYRFVTRRSPSGSQVVADYRTLITDQVTRVIGERLRAAGADDTVAEAWGHGVVGLVEAAGDWWLERRPVDRSELTDQLARLVWSGFAGGLMDSGGSSGHSSPPKAPPSPSGP